MSERRCCIQRDHPRFSVRRQCQLLGIHRSGLYYKCQLPKPEDLSMMRLVDAHYLEHPSSGVLTMQSHLQEHGYSPSAGKVRRMLRKMGIMAIYPKRNTSKLGQAKYIHPYLLRGLEITRSNQVWAIDITYIPMQKGFMYLTAVIDLQSRYVVGWDISNTLDARSSLRVLQQAIADYGKPDILNSDQGSQFSCKLWVEYLKSQSIQISMDGKGRAIDNVFIERLWRSVKYEYVYLSPAVDAKQLFEGLVRYFQYYNHRRPHQGIGRIKPAELYRPMERYRQIA
jgi:putative transposase